MDPVVHYAFVISFSNLRKQTMAGISPQSRNAQADAWAFLLPARLKVSARNLPPLYQVVCDIVQTNLT